MGVPAGEPRLGFYLFLAWYVALRSAKRNFPFLLVGEVSVIYTSLNAPWIHLANRYSSVVLSNLSWNCGMALTLLAVFVFLGYRNAQDHLLAVRSYAIARMNLPALAARQIPEGHLLDALEMCPVLWNRCLRNTPVTQRVDALIDWLLAKPAPEIRRLAFRSLRRLAPDAAHLVQTMHAAGAS